MNAQIEKLMKTLDISEAEALEILECDRRIDKCEKVFELTKEQSNKYKMKIVNEILKVSDDGKIYDVRGNEELVTDDDKLVGAYVYKYQGTRYRIYCELSPGVNGGRMAVGVETLEN